MYDKINLYGAGGHGRVVASQIQARWPEVDLCFGDMDKPFGSQINGVPITFAAPNDIKTGHLIVTIGDNFQRACLQNIAVSNGIKMGYFVADLDRYFADPPGIGSMVLAGSIVTSDVHIGAGVIVNSGAIVEHDSYVGDFCHLAPGSVLAGGTVLGARVFIGAGAQVVKQVHIAEGTVIGAGATVIRSITEPGVYAGSPAQLIGPTQTAFDH